MTLLDIIGILPDEVNVTVDNINGDTLATYDGRNSIPDKYNYCEVTKVNPVNDKQIYIEINNTMTKRDKLACDMINAVLAYGLYDLDIDERDLLSFLDNIGITFDDFVHSGHGNYGTMRDYYGIDDEE